MENAYKLQPTSLLATSNCEFIAQILTAIDSRANCWLEECKSKPTCCNMDDELVKFDDMQRMIKTRQFSFSLPPTGRCHASKEPNGNHDDHDNSRDDCPAKHTEKGDILCVT